MEFTKFKRDIQFLGNDETAIRFIVEKNGEEYEVIYDNMDFVNKHGVIVALKKEDESAYILHFSAKDLLKMMKESMGRRRNIVFEVDFNKNVYAAELVSVAKTIGVDEIEIELKIKEE